MSLKSGSYELVSKTTKSVFEIVLFISCYFIFFNTLRSSVQFAASCDGRSLSNEEISDAFTALAPEMLQSHFPIKIATPNTHEKQKV